MTAGRELVEDRHGRKVVQALDDFLRHADEAAHFVALRDELDPRTGNLVVESLVIRLGEAAKRADRGGFAADHPHLDFRRIIGARDFAAHGYDITDHQALWDALASALPASADGVRALLG